MADEAVAGSIGDRVERAIERHADTVGEIRRGEREKPRALRRNVRVAGRHARSRCTWCSPALVETFSSWRQITRFSPASMLVMFGLQVGVCACLWYLQRVALGGVRWRPVIAAQLVVQRAVEHRAGRRAARRGAAVPDLRGRRPGRAGGGQRADRGEPAGVRGRARAAGAGDPGPAARLGEPRPARGRRRGPGRVRGDRRYRRAADEHGPTVGLGGARRAVRPQPDPPRLASRWTTCRRRC